MRIRLYLFLGLCACGGRPEAEVRNLLDLAVTLEVRAPQPQLVGGCGQSFGDRFCVDEFEVVGVTDVAAGETRTVALSDNPGDDQCIDVLWLRLIRLGEVGPVDDRGTQFDLPAVVEIEEGAGAIHSVAFPQGTVRLDEVGGMDTNQAGPPADCSTSPS